MKNCHIENLYGNGWHTAMAILNYAFVNPMLDSEGAGKILRAYKYLYGKGAF